MASTEIVTPSNAELNRELDELRLRLAETERKLAEAQELIQAIQQGDVDAVIVSGRVLTLTEITERELAEDALRESRAKLKAALASMTDSVLITDAQGRFVEFNDSFASFYRFKSKAECAKNFAEFASIFEVCFAGGKPVPRAMYAINRALAGETGTNVECAIRRRDTGERWIGSISFSPIRDGRGAIAGSVITARDITEAKRAEMRLRRFYETDLFAILYWRIDGGVVDVNDKFLEMTGYTREDLRAGLLNWSKITPPEYWPLDDEARRQILETGVHLPFEKEFIRKDGTRVWGLFSAAAYEDDPSQGVSFILDITMRKRAEAALREEKATLQGILDATRESIWLIGADSTFLSANSTALKRWGGPAGEILGKTFKDILDPALAESRFACVRRVVETAQPLEQEDERAGMLFRHQYYPVVDSDGSINRVVAYSRDITESRKAEETLERYRLLAGHTRDIVLFIRVEDGLILEANAAAVKTYGYTIEQLKRMTIRDLREPGTRPLAPAEMAQAEMHGLLFESVHQRADGSVFPVEVSSQGAKIGQTRTLVSIIRDITERRQAEEALRESEERYRNLFNSMNEGFCVIEVLFDADGKPADYVFLETNSAFEKQTGLREAVGKRMRELAPEHEEHWFEIYGKIALTGEPAHFMNDAKALNRYYDVHAYRVGEPEQRRVAIVFNDFSDYKRAEQALRASEEQLQAIIDGAPETAVFLKDTAGRFITVNSGFERLLGVTRDEVRGKTDYDLLTRERAEEYRANDLEVLTTCQPIRIEESALLADGKVHTFLANKFPLLDAGGKPYAVCAISVDITGQKQIEADLRKNEERLGVALEVAQLGEWERNLDTGDGSRSLRHAKIFGYSSAESEWNFEIFLSHILPEHRAEVTKWFKSSMRGGSWDFETQIRRLDGELRWVWFRSHTSLDEMGKPSRAYGIVMDITDRKQAEESLKESTELLGLFVEHAPVALAMFDNQMRYLHASRLWKTNYGHGDRELRGVWHYDVFPELPEHWKEAHRRALAGEVLSAEADRFERPDGVVQWVRWEIRPWRDAEGKVGGIVIFTEDITRRREAEAAVQRSERLALQRQQLQALAKRLQQVREEERKMVARDLHDHIGQILTAIKFDMTWVDRHLPAPEDGVRKRLTGSIELINDCVKSVRKICSGLRPGILDDLGLTAAIEWQANEFSARTGVPCQLSLPSAALALDGDRATAIFRIFQECLTNVTRHAEAQTVHTSLQTEDGDLVLVVRDDGKGFHESQAAGSLGVLGMKERAAACGGSVQLSSSPGKGTAVAVRIPVDAASAEREDHEHSHRR